MQGSQAVGVLDHPDRGDDVRNSAFTSPCWRRAGAANLISAGGSDTIFSISPAVEFSAELRDGDAVIRPFLKAGVTFYDDSEQTLTASFAGAPAGTGEFTIRSSFDDVVADIEAGITAIHDDGTTLSFAYDGHIGESSAQHGLMLKGSLRY